MYDAAYLLFLAGKANESQAEDVTGELGARAPSGPIDVCFWDLG